jgi:hypothetical protein
MLTKPEEQKMWKKAWVLASFMLLSHSDWYMLYLEFRGFAIWLLQHGGEVC